MHLHTLAGLTLIALGIASLPLGLWINKRKFYPTDRWF